MIVLRLTPHYYFESGKWPREFDPLGGMQNQICALSEGLNEKNIIQHIITSGYPGAKQFKKGGLTVYTVSRFWIQIKSKISGILFFDAFWLCGTIHWLFANRKKINKFDLIHHHYSGTYASIFVFFLMNKLTDVPQVITVHCSKNFTYHPPNLRSKCMHHILKYLEIKSFRKAQKVILLTDLHYKDYCTLSKDASKVEVIGDQIPSYHLKVNEDKIAITKEQFHIRETRFNIAFVGRISFEKGCDFVIQVARILNQKTEIDFHFWVIGDGPQVDDLEKQVRRLGLEKYVTITGFVSKLSVPMLLRNMDLLFVPSIHEEFGGIILEGIAANLPIVTSGVGGIKKILGENYIGIVSNACAEEYAEKIRYFYRNKDEVGYCQKDILQSYIPCNINNRVCELYDGLINKEEMLNA